MTRDTNGHLCHVLKKVHDKDIQSLMGDDIGESVSKILSELDELEYSTGEKGRIY